MPAGNDEPGAAAALSLRAADDQAGMDRGTEGPARRAARPGVEVARRRAVHQLRRTVSSTRSRTSTRPTRRSSCSTTKAPDFSPLTPDELDRRSQARQAAAGRGGRGGGGGGGRGGAAPSALATRTAGRVVSRQEMFEETVYQPQQVLDVAAGRKVFEASCASCHRFGDDRHRPRRRRPEPDGLEAARVEARAARSGLLPRTGDRARARDDRRSTPATASRSAAWCVKENAQSISLLTPARHGHRRPEVADQGAPQDQDVDHAGRRWPRPSIAPACATSRRFWLRSKADFARGLATLPLMP